MELLAPTLLALSTLAGAAVAAQPARPHQGIAPDGRAGFGQGVDPQQVFKAFRSSKGPHAELVRGLRELLFDLRLELELARARYLERGYFAAIDGRVELQRLESVLEELPRHGFDAPMGAERAAALARAWHDLRLRLRRSLREDTEIDRRDLEGALALLCAAARGVAWLGIDGELETVVARADLAAARLRALRSDLHALSEAPRSPGPGGERVDELARMLEAGDPRGRLLLAEEAPRLARLAERMAQDLSGARLAERVASSLSRRRGDLAAAQRAVQEVRLLLPWTPEGVGAPPAIAARSATERYRQALELALAGLHRDPFDAELTYLTASAVDWGWRFSRAYHDRFLALRGIRHYEHESYARRALDDWERDALQRVLTPAPDQGEER